MPGNNIVNGTVGAQDLRNFFPTGSQMKTSQVERAKVAFKNLQEHVMKEFNDSRNQFFSIDASITKWPQL
jgi:hypothetical protein